MDQVLKVGDPVQIYGICVGQPDRRFVFGTVCQVNLNAGVAVVQNDETKMRYVLALTLIQGYKPTTDQFLSIPSDLEAHFYRLMDSLIKNAKQEPPCAY